ncbi:MAG: hypothetical protein HZA50_12210 [Planctomycetes bacterium]|nr:hypothetical protein [Planctomycetota bacterium]
MNETSPTTSRIAAEPNSTQAATARRLLARYGPALAVVLLLAAHWAMAVTAVRDKSATFDEGFHLTAGYSYWLAGDFRLDPESGFLAQRIMALPLLAGDYKFPDRNQPAWFNSHLPLLSQQFFYESPNDPDKMLLRARMMVAFLSVALGALVFCWSRRLFGTAGGLVSLSLYAFSPVMLSNGALATIDLTASLGFMLCATCFWAMLQRLTIWTLLASCGSVAFLLLAKMSAVLAAPMLLVLLVLRLIVARPLEIALPGLWRQITGRLAKAGVLAGALVVHVILAAAIIWAFFGFRYSAFADGVAGRDSFYNTRMVDQAAGPVADTVSFARRHRLLPEAYLYGFGYAMHGAQNHSAFLNGRYSDEGWPEFFPYVFLVKTPPETFVILLLATAAAWYKWRRRSAADGSPAGNGKISFAGAIYSTAPFWALLAIYWAAAIASNINIGVRHILPTYAPMYVLAGAAGWWLARAARRMKYVLGGLLVLAAAECLWIWPDYLAYFNFVAGGPSNAWRHLVDSSLDWGQDLPGLKKYLDRSAQAGGENVYLSYFGTSSPTYYGIKARRLPGYFDTDLAGSPADLRPLASGIYCISATCLMQAVAGGTAGPWTPRLEELYQKSAAALAPLLRAPPDQQRQMLRQPRIAEAWQSYAALRFSRLCAFLRTRPCDGQVGHSILIFRLSDADIRQSLEGPPASYGATALRGGQ